ncbi:MAG: UDP-N-acetylglucosamine pyrophosphorylase, partial [Oscillospiraceae bacterium]|nr:UDP-N-acetylglucosamine pyrophosphorylase [Oscillospiraceae bacterium]
SPLASVTGPAVVGPGAELRPGAYVRGKAVVCAGCVVGNSTELKNCVLLDGAKLPHFSYAGDSVIGRGAHFGAGTVASNLRLDGADVVVRDRQTGLAFATGLRKVGAFVGDGAELGCRCVLNPGTVVGRRAAVCPGAVLSGRIPEDSLVRADGRTARRTAGSGAE